MQMTLRDVLRAALSKNLPSGWVYLPRSDELLLDTPCLLLGDDYPDAEWNERGIPLAAVNQGFPTEGLDDATIEDTVEWARQFIDPPPDDLLLASFAYYLRFDAFLPAPDAPPPPPAFVSMRRSDLAFYNLLGPERSDKSCSKEGCRRGAVDLSIYCRVHHFEMIKGKPCPFSD
jgi:hypothetical protein